MTKTVTTRRGHHQLKAIVENFLKNPTPRKKEILLEYAPKIRKILGEDWPADQSSEPIGRESEVCKVMTGGGIGISHEYTIPVEFEDFVVWDEQLRHPTNGAPAAWRKVTKLMCACGAERERKT